MSEASNRLIGVFRYLLENGAIAPPDGFRQLMIKLCVDSLKENPAQVVMCEIPATHLLFMECELHRLAASLGVLEDAGLLDQAQKILSDAKLGTIAAMQEQLRKDKEAQDRAAKRSHLKLVPEDEEQL